VLAHLPELVVKAVDEAGGYGMLMGPQATAAQVEEFRRRIEAEPRKYIAQPPPGALDVPDLGRGEGVRRASPRGPSPLCPERPGRPLGAAGASPGLRSWRDPTS